MTIIANEINDTRISAGGRQYTIKTSGSIATDDSTLVTENVLGSLTSSLDSRVTTLEGAGSSGSILAHATFVNNGNGTVTFFASNNISSISRISGQTGRLRVVFSSGIGTSYTLVSGHSIPNGGNNNHTVLTGLRAQSAVPMNRSSGSMDIGVILHGDPSRSTWRYQTGFIVSFACVS